MITDGHEAAPLATNQSNPCMTGYQPAGLRLSSVLDPEPCHDTCARSGLPRLGSDTDRERWAATAWFVLGVGTVGTSLIRPTIVELYAAVRWATICHNNAWISPAAELQEGAVVLAGMGAVVLSPVSAGTTVVGCPARPWSGGKTQ